MRNKVSITKFAAKNSPVRLMTVGNNSPVRKLWKSTCAPILVKGLISGKYYISTIFSAQNAQPLSFNTQAYKSISECTTRKSLTYASTLAVEMPFLKFPIWSVTGESTLAKSHIHVRFVGNALAVGLTWNSTRWFTRTKKQVRITAAL